MFSDTTGTTLTYLFWELAKHPEWQAKVQGELDLHPVKAERDTLLEFRHVSELPVLGAVINETLRLHPAGPGGLPRETPSPGRSLNGYFIPGGVGLMS